MLFQISWNWQSGSGEEKWLCEKVYEQPERRWKFDLFDILINPSAPVS